jgi:hypothetical protein
VFYASGGIVLPEHGNAMRFIIANEFYQQMLATEHTPDCYVRPGEYLTMYLDG